jgi:hypothetical protein
MAQGLRTLSDFVDTVATSPTTGQILTATSPTAANWQDPGTATILRFPQNTSVNPPVNSLCKQSTTGGPVTVNLPAVHVVGDTIIVKMTSASTNNITIDANASHTIDGALTLVMNTGYECVTLVSDGVNWMQTA